MRKIVLGIFALGNLRSVVAEVFTGRDSDSKNPIQRIAGPMGCCQSSPEGPTPRHGETSNGGGRGTRSDDGAALAPTREFRYNDGDATGADIVRLGSGNRRLAPFGAVVWEAQPPITASQLERRRTDFWETRTDGRRETWEILRLVVSSRDMGTAQAIIDDGGLRLPTGNLVDGCFDAFGAVYRLPPFAISDPANLKAEEDPAAQLRAAESATVPRDSVELSAAAALNDAVASGSAQPNVILRFSNGTDKKVYLPPDSTGRLVRSLAIANQDSQKGTRLLVFYLGRPLTDAVLVKNVVKGLGENAATDLPVLQIMIPSA